MAGAALDCLRGIFDVSDGDLCRPLLLSAVKGLCEPRAGAVHSECCIHCSLRNSLVLKEICHHRVSSATAVIVVGIRQPT